MFLEILTEISFGKACVKIFKPKSDYYEAIVLPSLHVVKAIAFDFEFGTFMDLLVCFNVLSNNVTFLFWHALYLHYDLVRFCRWKRALIEFENEKLPFACT